MENTGLFNTMETMADEDQKEMYYNSKSWV